MPSHSERQRRFMGAELAREREGKKTKTGMSEGQLEDFASKPVQSANDSEREEKPPEGHDEWLKHFEYAVRSQSPLTYMHDEAIRRFQK